MIDMRDDPRPYDVYLMWVEFPDHPGVGKPRPVVVTDVDGDLMSGIVAKVTGNITWDKEGDVPLLDWRDAGLVKPSLVRCAQRFRFRSGDLLQWFGRLSVRDAERVVAGIEATPDVRPHERGDMHRVGER